MSFFKTLLLLVLTTQLPGLAKATVFIEPSLGYRSHTLRLTDFTNSDIKVIMATAVYGLKIGYRSPLGIDLNLAYDYSSGKAELAPLAEKNNFSHGTAAVHLGINALSLMKIYLGYGFLNELKIQQGLLNSDMSLKGLSYQAGLQFKLFYGVMFGAQYNLNQFKTIQGKNYILGEAIENYYNKVDSQDFSINLSMSF